MFHPTWLQAAATVQSLRQWYESSWM